MKLSPIEECNIMAKFINLNNCMHVELKWNYFCVFFPTKIRFIYNISENVAVVLCENLRYDWFLYSQNKISLAKKFDKIY